MSKEELEKKWKKLDKEIWDRTRYLTLTCTPYDMDEEYQKLLKEERELKKKMKVSNG